MISDRRNTGLHRRMLWLLLAGLLLWSAGLRIWFAGNGLRPGHYWDERYSVRNLRSVLATGNPRPVNFYYPSLSYLPQALLMTTAERVAGLVGNDFTFFSNGRLRSEGYLAARLIQVSFGLASLLVTFLLGRKLFSAETGLVAAAILASSPLHIRLSTMFKPDITLCLTILLALLWSIMAIERPSLGRYLLAGGGIGLALAAKLNGGPVAIPLTIAAAFLGWRYRRHWAWLAAAGSTAAVTFLALNPEVHRYLDALGRNQAIYAGKARGPDPTFVGRVWDLLVRECGFLVSPGFHGAIFGTLAILGIVVLLIAPLRRRGAPPAAGSTIALTRAMLLSFPIAYSLVYAAATPYAKANNFLPLLPVTSLAAANLLVEAWRLAKTRLPSLETFRAQLVAGVVLALAITVPAQAWAYDAQVPTTWDLALRRVSDRLRPWAGRVAYFEAAPLKFAGVSSEQKAMIRVPSRLGEVPPDLLDQSDAEIFLTTHLEGLDGETYLQRQDRAARVETLSARPFRARGPGLTLLFHVRERIDTETLDFEYDNEDIPSFHLDPISSPAEASTSLSFRLRRPANPDLVPTARRGDQVVRLYSRRVGKRNWWISERLPASDQAMVLQVPRPLLRGERLQLSRHHWAAPEG